MQDGVIHSDKDALYMEGKREDFENARTQPVGEQRA
jgi:hypothetical protein